MNHAYNAHNKVKQGTCADPEGETGGPDLSRPGKSQVAVGFLTKSGTDPLEKRLDPLGSNCFSLGSNWFSKEVHVRLLLPLVQLLLEGGPFPIASPLVPIASRRRPVSNCLPLGSNCFSKEVRV